jgi:hypothetical protein
LTGQNPASLSAPIPGNDRRQKRKHNIVITGSEIVDFKSSNGVAASRSSRAPESHAEMRTAVAGDYELSPDMRIRIKRTTT